MQRRNWALWGGLALAIVAFLSYFILFSRWPVTRDVPWVNYILFAIALGLLFVGLRRAIAEHHSVRGVIAMVAGVVIAAGFVYGIVVGSKDMTAFTNVPRVGQKAPDFTLRDANGKPVVLSQLAAANRGVLLVFYRGYW